MAKLCVYLINRMYVLLDIDLWKHNCVVAKKDFDIVKTWVWTQLWHLSYLVFSPINEHNKWLWGLNARECQLLSHCLAYSKYLIDGNIIWKCFQNYNQVSLCKIHLKKKNQVAFLRSKRKWNPPPENLENFRGSFPSCYKNTSEVNSPTSAHTNPITFQE